MSDCEYCPVEKDCHYPYKPCDCVGQRKFWSSEKAESVKNKNELPIPNTTKPEQEKGDHG